MSKSNACCLFWMAGSSLQADQAQVLRRLHSEMLECVRRVGGKTLEDNATCGLVQLAPRERGGGMSTEDAAVRLGELQSFELPASGRRAHLGPVVESCRSLAL